MKSFRFLAATALATSTLFSVSGPAWAQTAPAADEDEGEVIIVTGSRIQRPNDTSSIPITSIQADDLTAAGSVSLGDSLNKLPSLRSTFSQANSTRFIGTSGLSLLDLRGLGTARTLVLVNGRRHVTSQPGANSVDTNTLPTDLIERVDVVTGGNSAIYGSDAVAGVVNFITKRDFEGIRLRAQGGTSSRGDRGSYFGSLTAGTNFADDRGNVAVALEYAKSNTLYNTSRDAQTGAFSGRSQFQLTENALNNPQFTGAEPAAGNGIFDTTFTRGVRNMLISDGSMYTSVCPALTGTAANAAIRAVNCNGLRGNTGAELGYTFGFDETGNLIRNNVTTDFRPFGSGNGLGSIGSTLRNTGMLQPGLERKAANILASFEVSDAFKPFIEAKFVKINANQEGQPTFHGANVYSIDNPFLTAASRALLVSSLAAGVTTFTTGRFNVDFGGRGEKHQRELYRIVGGTSGTFNDDWNYELALNYGHLKTFYRTEGNIDTAKFNNSRAAVRNAAGAIVCGINNDATAANDDAACVPVNLFGYGLPSQAALNYFLVDSTREQTASQFVASGFVSGDLSQIFELPGGPIGFSIGGEYRREKAFSSFDAFTRSGATFLNSIAPFTPPTVTVKELFGEVRIPLLKDMFLAHELTIEASGRMSKYAGNTGTVYAYNVGGTYAPIPDIRFRVNYGKSVRAPTSGDLFSAQAQTFVNGLADPCAQNNINNNPNRRANCLAAGVPVTEVVNGVTVPWTNLPASGVFGFNGGNPNAKEETGKSLTAGVVLKPRFIPGLTIAVDYYDITLDDVIFTLNGQTIIDQCYDSASGINNLFCANVFRRPDGTFAGQANRVVGGVTVTLPTTGPSFISGPFNFAKQETSGVDAEVNYSTNITDGIKLNLNSIVSYLIKRNNFTNVLIPTFQDRLKSELGDPEWAGSMTVGLDFGAFDLRYNMRYIGKQTVAATYETQNSVQGRPPLNADNFPRVFYPTYTYHNIRVGYDVNKQFRVYAGIDNLTDKLPPFDLLGVAGGDPFDNVGRFFFAGVEAKF